MKIIFISTILLLLPTAETLASDEQENACTPILLACEDKGYVDDQVAEPGQKIWADCADPIINQNQPVRGLTIDPLRLKLCRKYKMSRDNWERQWASRHPVIDKD